MNAKAKEELCTTNEIARLVGVHFDAVKAAMTSIGMEAQLVFKAGKKSVSLYPTEATVAAVKDYFDKQEAAEKAKAKAEAKAPAAATSNLGALVKEVELLGNRSAELKSSIDAFAIASCDAVIELRDDIRDIQNKTKDQNAALLRAIESLKADINGSLLSRVNALQESIDMLAERLPAKPQPVVEQPVVTLKSVPTIAPPAPLKKVVTVIGVTATQADTVRKEFGSVFDLRILLANYHAHDIAPALNGADAVVAMQALANAPLIRKIKDHQLHPILINGLSGLRDKLTQMFVEQGKAA